MEKENRYRGVTTLIIVLAITFFVVLETKLLVGGSAAEPALGANGYVGIFEPAAEKVPAAIVSRQSYEVDGVSGATMTSDGIMKAVKNAMEQAAK